MVCWDETESYFVEGDYRVAFKLSFNFFLNSSLNFSTFFSSCFTCFVLGVIKDNPALRANRRTCLKEYSTPEHSRITSLACFVFQPAQIISLSLGLKLFNRRDKSLKTRFENLQGLPLRGLSFKPSKPNLSNLFFQKGTLPTEICRTLDTSL